MCVEWCEYRVEQYRDGVYRNITSDVDVIGGDDTCGAENGNAVVFCWRSGVRLTTCGGERGGVRVCLIVVCV